MVDAITVIIGLCFIGLSIVMHELGHFFTFVIIFGYTPEVTFFYEGIRSFGIEMVGKQRVYNRVVKEDKYHVYLWGIVAGLFTLIPAVFISRFYWVLIPVYFFGCRDDLQGLLDNPPR